MAPIACLRRQGLIGGGPVGRVVDQHHDFVTCVETIVNKAYSIPTLSKLLDQAFQGNP